MGGKVPTKNDIERMKTYANEGLSAKAIADKMKFSSATVSNRLKGEGFLRIGGKWVLTEKIEEKESPEAPQEEPDVGEREEEEDDDEPLFKGAELTEHRRRQKLERMLRLAQVAPKAREWILTIWDEDPNVRRNPTALHELINNTKDMDKNRTERVVKSVFSDQEGPRDEGRVPSYYQQPYGQPPHMQYPPSPYRQTGYPPQDYCQIPPRTPYPQQGYYPPPYQYPPPTPQDKGFSKKDFEERLTEKQEIWEAKQKAEKEEEKRKDLEDEVEKLKREGGGEGGGAPGTRYKIVRMPILDREGKVLTHPKTGEVLYSEEKFPEEEEKSLTAERVRAMIAQGQGGNRDEIERSRSEAKEKEVELKKELKEREDRLRDEREKRHTAELSSIQAKQDTKFEELRKQQEIHHKEQMGEMRAKEARAAGWKSGWSDGKKEGQQGRASEEFTLAQNEMNTRLKIIEKKSDSFERKSDMFMHALLYGKPPPETDKPDDEVRRIMEG